MGVTPTSPTTAPPPFEKIYKQPMLVVHHPNPPVTVPDPYLVPAVCPVSTVYEDEALTDALQELRPNRLQKEGPGAKSLSGTALP